MGFTLWHVIRVVRRIVFAALVIALLAPVMPTAIVHAAGNTQYVSTYLDNSGAQIDCRDVATGCSLRDALNAAADGDTIQFAHGIFGWPITYTLDPKRGTLIVGHSVTIQGPGADNLTISGGNAVSVFTVNSGVTTINGLTIANGNSNGNADGNAYGGGIFNQGTLTVAQSVIQNNSAPNGPGGGVYNAGALTLTGCTISGNSTGSDGGGVGDGSSITLATSLTITGSTITGNIALAGGGIYTHVGIATITGSTVQGNHAMSGGGIANGYNSGGNTRTGSVVTITGSTVRDNQATATGGGIYTNNSLTLTNTTVSGNQGGGNGAGLFNEPVFGNAARAMLVATTVSNNTVSGGGSSGGGINDASGATVTLTDSIVAGNMATGGATAADLANAFTSGGHNLIGIATGSTGIMDGMDGDHVGTASAPINPRFSPLAANGGPTATHALRLNSPAIEAGGSCPSGIAQDQRGQPRVGNCDIGAYEYQPVTPTIMNATAPTSGGSVTFHGTGFQAGSQLTIGNTTLTAPASGVSDDGTAFTVTVPTHSVGNVSVVVANPGSGHVAAGTLTYQPVVTSLSTTSGSVTGGTPVMIIGAGFVAGSTSVMFGTASATVTNVTATTITVTVPVYAAGMVGVTVTVNGVSGTKAGAYTYGTVNPIAPIRPPGSPVTSPPPSLPSPRPTASPVSGPTLPLPPSR